MGKYIYMFIGQVEEKMQEECSLHLFARSIFFPWVYNISHLKRTIKSFWYCSLDVTWRRQELSTYRDFVALLLPPEKFGGIYVNIHVAKIYSFKKCFVNACVSTHSSINFALFKAEKANETAKLKTRNSNKVEALNRFMQLALNSLKKPLPFFVIPVLFPRGHDSLDNTKNWNLWVKSEMSQHWSQRLLSLCMSISRY